MTIMQNCSETQLWIINEKRKICIFQGREKHIDPRLVLLITFKSPVFWSVRRQNACWLTTIVREGYMVILLRFWRVWGTRDIFIQGSRWIFGFRAFNVWYNIVTCHDNTFQVPFRFWCTNKLKNNGWHVRHENKEHHVCIQHKFTYENVNGS